MKYVFLGTINQREWEAPERAAERMRRCREKFQELGIAVLHGVWTQGPYDFVDILEASDSIAPLAFSMWWGAQGYGRITTMAAFDRNQITEARQQAGLAAQKLLADGAAPGTISG
jgi:uncharacterized protein with GYD domain